MPKRGKESRPSSRHSGGRFSPPPPPPSRPPRNDYQVAGSSRSTSDSSSGRRSPHSKDIIKISNGNTSHGNSSNRMLMNVVNSPIILTDDDDGDDDYKNVDTSMNIFRENGNKLNPDTGECTRLVKHFVPSADRYHMSQSVPEKPMFRGPETDVLHELEKDKLKNIRVQMIRADIQQNDCFRKAYVVEEPVAAANRSKGDKNHQNFDDRQTHFNQNPMHYDNDKNYGISHQLNSPRIISSRDRSLSPRNSNDRPPSPPQPYSPERDHFNSDNMLRRDRKRSPDRNRERSPRAEHFLDQHKMDNFSSGPPPEPHSPPDIQRFRSGDLNSRHRTKDESIHYENRSRRSGSPVYFENHYPYRSPSPDIRPFSPNQAQLSMSRELSPPPPRDRPSHPIDRPRRRRMTPPPRRERSKERRRRLSPRRRTPPLTRSPVKRRENGKKRPNKNQEARKREAKDRKRRSESKTKMSPQQDQTSFQQTQPQPMYPPPPPGVVRMPPPPRPFPPGPMMIPMRPPPFPPPMGGWRPPRPPMQAPPPSGWPYPRPRPFYFPY